MIRATVVGAAVALVLTFPIAVLTALIYRFPVLDTFIGPW